MTNDFEGPPRRKGRPATGQGVKLDTRIPQETAARIQSVADERFTTFADAVRLVIERGLNVAK